LGSAVRPIPPKGSSEHDGMASVAIARAANAGAAGPTRRFHDVRL
jgi:hypothetical protein